MSAKIPEVKKIRYEIEVESAVWKLAPLSFLSQKPGETLLLRNFKKMIQTGEIYF
jgi:hypothetical protein